jgi:plasmid stabilization system protein ParE
VIDRELRFAQGADEDLVRLFTFLAERDPMAAEQALVAIRKGLALAAAMPWSCRRASADSPLRECVISFGQGGYVAAFEIGEDHILVLAIRHQREDDFH